MPESINGLEVIKHEPDEQGPRQLRYPGGKDGMWVASCICRVYTSQPQGTPEAAARQVAKHIEGKLKYLAAQQGTE